MRVRVWVVWALVLLVAGNGLCRGEEPAGLVVHEWGVLVKQQISSGIMLGSPEELAAELPGFVVRQKARASVEMGVWKKPVIWFYGPEQAHISVKVMASEGFATANFPAAELLTRKFRRSDPQVMQNTLVTEPAGFRWEGSLTRQPTGKLPEVAKDHWWKTARDAGGLYFNTGNVSERFIFYEATAFRDTTVSATVTADAITIRNDHYEPSGQVIVLVNTADKHFIKVVEGIGVRAEQAVGKDALLKEAATADAVLAACTGQWKSCGMTEAEGRAIAAVWREDLLQPNRMLLISRVPAKYYEAMFPLTIEPAPKELVRVGMVFDLLDSQAEANSWLPELEKTTAKAARDLGSSDYKERERASAELAKQGERARSTLEQLVKSKDPEVRSRAETLLQKLESDVEAPAQEGTDSRGVTVHALQ